MNPNYWNEIKTRQVVQAISIHSSIRCVRSYSNFRQNKSFKFSFIVKFRTTWNFASWTLLVILRILIEEDWWNLQKPDQPNQFIESTLILYLSTCDLTGINRYGKVIQEPAICGLIITFTFHRAPGHQCTSAAT